MKAAKCFRGKRCPWVRRRATWMYGELGTPGSPFLLPFSFYPSHILSPSLSLSRLYPIFLFIYLFIIHFHFLPSFSSSWQEKFRRPSSSSTFPYTRPIVVLLSRWLVFFLYLLFFFFFKKTPPYLPAQDMTRVTRACPGAIWNATFPS